MPSVKKGILTFLRWLYRSVLLFINTLLSVIRVLLYSKPNTGCVQLRDIKNRIFVLGNGPSLRPLIENKLQFLAGQNLLVVNDFFLDEHFAVLKPHVYVIADPGYWDTHDTGEMLLLRQKMQQILVKEVNWELLFFVPVAVYKTGHFQEIFQKNTHIKIAQFNTTSFVGTRKMRYFFYDKLLAKPFSGNVIGSALFLAFQMQVEEIFLFGVEHSWTRGLFVDDQNRTCICNEHFYDNAQSAKVWLKTNASPYAIHEALFDIAVMLGGYREINEYAVHKGIKIYNCTPGSFIDAFERKELGDLIA